MMTNEETLALCAIRYTMGRMSYIVADGQRWAVEWGSKSPHVRKVLIKDLAYAIEDEDRYFIPEGKEVSALGCMKLDSPGWREVYRTLKRMEDVT